MIGTVIVTYNRLEKLKIALASYERQSLLPDYIMVINNASNDGTLNWLMEWKKKKTIFPKYVINLHHNLGGSGGFYFGQKIALSLSSPWIWFSDDDAYPNPDAFEIANNVLSSFPHDIAALCGTIDQPFRGHRCRLRKFGILRMYESIDWRLMEKKIFELDLISYVGCILNKEKLREAGLIDKDYFIWFDDYEHCLRLRKTGKILCIPLIHVKHDVDDAREKLSWKNYYHFRNELHGLIKNFPIRGRIFGLLVFPRALFSLLKGSSMELTKMKFVAYINAILGKLGQHHVYRPGWKPKQK